MGVLSGRSRGSSLVLRPFELSSAPSQVSAHSSLAFGWRVFSPSIPQLFRALDMTVQPSSPVYLPFSNPSWPLGIGAAYSGPITTIVGAQSRVAFAPDFFVAVVGQRGILAASFKATAYGNVSEPEHCADVTAFVNKLYMLREELGSEVRAYLVGNSEREYEMSKRVVEGIAFAGFVGRVFRANLGVGQRVGIGGTPCGEQDNAVEDSDRKPYFCFRFGTVRQWLLVVNDVLLDMGPMVVSAVDVV